MGEFTDKDDKKKYISKETFDRLKCNEVFEGDILISRLPSPAGRACIFSYKKMLFLKKNDILKSGGTRNLLLSIAAINIAAVD